MDKEEEKSLGITQFLNELAARSTKTGKGIIQVLMNLDWRETNSFAGTRRKEKN